MKLKEEVSLKDSFQEVKMNEVECLKCGHKWIPRVGNPRQCPKCKKYSWLEEKVERRLEEEDGMGKEKEDDRGETDNSSTSSRINTTTY